MSVLSRFVELFDAEAGVSAPPAVEAAGVVEVPSDDAEQAARREVERAEIQLADLTARREKLVSTIAGLSAERSRLSRLMAAGDLDAEARFAEVEVSLSSSQARLSGVDELLGEAEATLKAAHAVRNESMKPRLAAERRARIEGLRLAAEAEVERLYASYRECSASTARLADRLEELAAADEGAASAIFIRVVGPATDPLAVLRGALWTPHQPGRYCVRDWTVFPYTPPEGKG